MKIDYYQGILFSCVYQVGHIVAFLYARPSDEPIRVTQLIPLNDMSDLANYELFNTGEYLGVVCSSISEDTILSINYDSLLCITPAGARLVHLSSLTPMRNREVISDETIEFNRYGWSLFEKFSDRVKRNNSILLKLVDILKKSSVKDLSLINLVNLVDENVFKEELHKACLTKEETDSMVQILTSVHSDNVGNLISIIYEDEIDN